MVPVSSALSWHIQIFFACANTSGPSDHLYRIGLYPTRWAPTSYKWSYNPYKWPYKWVTGVITLLIEVIIPFITSRGPPCRHPVIPPEVQCLIGMPLGSSYTEPQEV